MFGDPKAAQERLMSELLFAYEVYLDRDPSDDDLLALIRDNYELRAVIAADLIRKRHPSNDMLIQVMDQLGSGEEALRKEAWERIKRREPSIDTLLKVMGGIKEHAEEIADDLLARQHLSEDVLQAIMEKVPTRFDEAVRRLLSEPHRLDATELYRLVQRLGRKGEPIETGSRLRFVWKSFCDIGPTVAQLAHVTQTPDHPLRLEAWFEIRKLEPDSPELCKTTACDELKPMVAAEILRAADAVTPEQLLWVMSAAPERADEAWTLYLARKPEKDKLIRLMQDMPARRERTWKALRRRKLEADDLSRLIWNLPAEWHAQIWKRLKRMELTNVQLRSLCKETPQGLEAAKMLLARKPDLEDLKAVARNVPSLRGKIRRRLAKMPKLRRELRDWMGKTAENMQD